MTEPGPPRLAQQPGTHAAAADEWGASLGSPPGLNDRLRLSRPT